MGVCVRWSGGVAVPRVRKARRCSRLETGAKRERRSVAAAAGRVC